MCAELFPTCVCSNMTLPPDPQGPPCRNGTCPPPLNPLTYKVEEEGQSCGNKDQDHGNWNVFCTTVLLTEEGETPSCAPYKNPPPPDWNTCSNLLTSTLEMSSSLFATSPDSGSQKDNCITQNCPVCDLSRWKCLPSFSRLLRDWNLTQFAIGPTPSKAESSLTAMMAETATAISTALTITWIPIRVSRPLYIDATRWRFDS